MKYKVAVVTGASSGIGKAIAESLAKQGVRLILVARRSDRLEQLQRELQPHTECYIVDCDVTNKKELTEKLAKRPAEFADIDILINCAGLALGVDAAQETEWQDWETMLNVNCVALSYLTHFLLPGMVERDCGHIVNIGSTAGNYPYKGGNVYGATKAYVDFFTLNLKADLLGTSVRVTNIDPGMVDGTEFSLVRYKGNKDKADEVYKGIEALHPADISESVLWVLRQPAHVNIRKIEIMPVSQGVSRTAYNRNGVVKEKI